MTRTATKRTPAKSVIVQRVDSLAEKWKESLLLQHPEIDTSWALKPLVSLALEGVTHLRSAIENPALEYCTWRSPLAGMLKEIPLDWDEVGPGLFFVQDQQLGFVERLTAAIDKRASESEMDRLLKAMTKSVAYVSEDPYTEGDYYILPDEEAHKVNEMVEPFKQEYISEFIANNVGSEYTNFQSRWLFIRRGVQYRVQLILSIRNIMRVRVADRKIFYSVAFGFGIDERLDISKWTAKEREDLWAGIRAALLIDFPEFAEQSGSNEFQDVQPVSSLEKQKIVRMGRHVEQSRFSSRPRPNDPSLFDTIGDESLAAALREHNISKAGIWMDAQTNPAHTAVLTLLAETDYKGNMEPAYSSVPGYEDVLVPRVKVSKPDFLRRCGIPFNSRGADQKMRALPKREQAAMQGLHRISSEHHLLRYKRQVLPKKNRKTKELESRYQIVETVAPLVRLYVAYDNLTEEETRIVEEGAHATLQQKQSIGRKTSFVIEFHPIHTDQIDSYYIYKPANYNSMLEESTSRSPFYRLLIDYLLLEVNAKLLKHRVKGTAWDWSISRKRLTWAHTLQMDSYLATRNHKRIQETLHTLFAEAIRQGWLNSTNEGVPGAAEVMDIVHVNPDHPSFRAVVDQLRREKAALPSPAELVEDEE